MLAATLGDLVRAVTTRSLFSANLAERCRCFREENDALSMETFVRAIDAPSFSGAARQLRVGQPAVSKAIAQLRIA
jgi:hypothetical protein